MLSIDILAKLLNDRAHELARKRIRHIALQQWGRALETEAKIEENSLIRKQLTKEEEKVSLPLIPTV